MSAVVRPDVRPEGAPVLPPLQGASATLLLPPDLRHAVLGTSAGKPRHMSNMAAAAGTPSAAAEHEHVHAECCASLSRLRLQILDRY